MLLFPSEELSRFTRQVHCRWPSGCAISTRTSADGEFYSLHAPEVECIGKGNAHRHYEFGVKVSVATTLNRSKGGQLIGHVKALPAIPTTATRSRL